LRFIRHRSKYSAASLAPAPITSGRHRKVVQ
jgi:hypothetical protein